MNTKDRKIVIKGWGKEEFINNKDGYCGKLLIFDEGKKLSLHRHLLKTEHFLCQSGSIELIVYDDPELDQYILNWDNFYNNCPNAPDNLEKPKLFIMKPGESFHIPIGRRHTMKAFEESVLIEFSTTDYVYDSYRILKGD